MAQKDKLKYEDVKAWKVECWGACIPYHPCGIDYVSTKDGKAVRATTGAIVEDIDPHSVERNDLVERGMLVPIQWKKGKEPKHG